MERINLKFSSNAAGITYDKLMLNNQIDPKFRRMFSNLKVDNNFITIDSFINILEENGWTIPLKDLRPSNYENIDPEKYNDYIFKSKGNELELHLFFPIVYDRNDYKSNFLSAQNKLYEMSKNSEKINDNTTPITEGIISPVQSENVPKVVVDNRQSTKIKVYINSVKKLFKERPKVAIALCTLAAVATVTAGGFIIKTAVDRIETQQFLDNHKQQVETTAPPDYNLNSFIDETRKIDEVNYSNEMAKQQYEDVKMQEKEESNQKIR